MSAEPRSREPRPNIPWREVGTPQEGPAQEVPEPGDATGEGADDAVARDVMDELRGLLVGPEQERIEVLEQQPRELSAEARSALEQLALTLDNPRQSPPWTDV